MEVGLTIRTARGQEVATRFRLRGSALVETLRWLGLEPEGRQGVVPAVELARRCRGRLWEPARRPGRRGVADAARDEALRSRAADLLYVARVAGDGAVCWG